MTTKLETQPRPKMLKDFLQDNTTTTNNTFTNHYYYLDPIPVKAEHKKNKMYADLSLSAKSKEIVSEIILPRSRSKSREAAEALGKLLNNAVKAFHSSTPLTLQRSVSRRLLGFENMRKKWSFNFNNKKRDKLSKCCSSEVVTKTATIVVVNVKVKDILRWRSFRNHISDVDDEVEEYQPLDVDVGSSDDAPRNNVTDGEFTVTEELELPCCLSEGEKWDEVSEVGVALDTHVGPQKDNHNMAEEEIEQQSPISILESPFSDEVSDEEFLSSFDQSLANMERTKQRLLQSIQLFESLAGVHKDYDFEDEEEEEEEESREEDNTNEVNKNKTYLSRGFSWFTSGEKSLEEKIVCMKVMDEQSQWGKFKDERVELGVDLEVALLKDLLDDILIDFAVEI